MRIGSKRLAIECEEMKGANKWTFKVGTIVVSDQNPKVRTTTSNESSTTIEPRNKSYQPWLEIIPEDSSKSKVGTNHPHLCGWLSA